MLSNLKKHLPATLVFLAALALYALTAQTGVSWQDGGLHQWRIQEAIYLSDMGVATSHPLYVAICRLISSALPFLSPCRAINLVSSLFGAAAVTAVFTLVSRLSASRLPAFAAASALAVSHMFWWLSCTTEDYTLSAFLLACELLAFERFLASRRPARAILGFAVAGAHLAVHNLALLALPAYAAAVFLASPRPARLKTLSLCALAWLAAAAPLWIVAARYFLAHDSNLLLTVQSTLFGDAWMSSVLGKIPSSPKLVWMNYALAALSFANPAWLLLCPRGLARSARTPFLRLLLAVTAIHFLFWIRYFIPDQATFLLPSLTLFSLWLGVGCATLRPSPKLAALLALGVLCAVSAPVAVLLAARSSILPIPSKRQTPFRDEAAYWLLPWKHNENSADRFIEAIRQKLRPGDALFAHSTAASAILASGICKNAPWKLYTATSQYPNLQTVLSNSPSAYTVSAAPGYSVDPQIPSQPLTPSPPLLKIHPTPPHPHPQLTTNN